jgi:hypothetical protein
MRFERRAGQAAVERATKRPPGAAPPPHASPRFDSAIPLAYHPAMDGRALNA